MQTDALRELPDMSNGNRTRKTTCAICIWLRKFLCSKVNRLKLGNTIPISIYICIFFCDRGSGKCCCISKIQVFLDARYVACSVLSCYWTCFGALSASLCRQTIHSSLSLYNALSKEFAIGYRTNGKKGYDFRHDYLYRAGYP